MNEVDMDPGTYRQVMKLHAGAPVVVATGRPGARTGLTATAFCSLSDAPPTVLVCVNKSASAHPVIESMRAFSVNILRQDQEDVAACFAGRTGRQGEDRFTDSGRWITGESGAPVLAEALASLDCELVQAHDYMTHSVFVGRVLGARSDDVSDPLIYFRGGFSALQTQGSAAGQV